MRFWLWLNNLRWFTRCPLKLAVFVVGTILVLFPKIWLMPTVMHRYRDMNAMLEPNNPHLAELEERVRADLPPNATPRDALPVVQRAVYERIPYGWDWDVWGVAEYLPTVDEVFEHGREDCDGRAVVAASLLRRLGHDAWLVSDLLHVWVETPEGQTMSPGSGEKTLEGTTTGTVTTVITPGFAQNAARGLAFGAAVFPLTRELIILSLFCALALQPRSPIWRRVIGCLLVAIALTAIRCVGQNIGRDAQTIDVLVITWAVTLLLTGWLLLTLRAEVSRPRSVATRPE